MAILFDWYEDPKPSAREGGEKTLHPRIKQNGTASTNTLRDRIQRRCSLTRTDVSAVLDALSQVMGEELADGRRVHLDGIGYFHPTLTTTEPVTEDTKRKNTKVKLKAITFRADQALKNEVGKIKAKCLEGNFHSDKITNEEIDRRLTRYFTTHAFMRRKDFQALCGLLVSTANHHLRRLCSEGKLKNAALPKQPIYVPANGYYAENKEITE
ncbi:HU family DNA-binding protein [Phocaeicola sp.]